MLTANTPVWCCDSFTIPESTICLSVFRADGDHELVTDPRKKDLALITNSGRRFSFSSVIFDARHSQLEPAQMAKYIALARQSILVRPGFGITDDDLPIFIAHEGINLSITVLQAIVGLCYSDLLDDPGFSSELEFLSAYSNVLQEDNQASLRRDASPIKFSLGDFLPVVLSSGTSESAAVLKLGSRIQDGEYNATVFTWMGLPVRVVQGTKIKRRVRRMHPSPLFKRDYERIIEATFAEVL